MAKRKKTTKKNGSKSKSKNLIKKSFGFIKNKAVSYLGRRPHRSFRLAKRRDHVRNLSLPGYIAFTKYVIRTLSKNRKTFLLLALVYAVLTGIVVGMASQDLYGTLSDTFNNSGGIFAGFVGEITKAGMLFASAATGGVTNALSESQQIFAVVMILLAWLTSVWLLRNIMAGHKVKLRDGLYNSGAPILPTFLIALLGVFQLLPVALATIGYSAANTTGLLAGGVEAMLFWFAAGLLTLVSIYFLTSTVFALVIITLPGMYPTRAIKTAGDLVVGRRFRILLRFIWMGLVTMVSWAIIMIPIIIFDSWLKSVWSGIGWVPIVPVFILVLSSLTVIWVSSYVYLLYRKVIDNESV
ncbi:MAG: hypothetical protein WCI79_00440 [Candidatus Saccharibacteria bacterium]